MQITAIKEQLKNAGRVSIFVDGKYSFSLSLDEFLAEKLAKGQELDEARLKLLKKLSAEGKFRQRALEWLMRRPHSIKEFRDYLHKKQAELDLIESLVEQFLARRYLDDRAFTLWFIEQRRAHKQRSRRAIVSELRFKGVNSETIAEAMEEEPGAEQTALLVLIAKKRRLRRYQEDEKLMTFLVRQGYSYIDVKAAMAGVDNN